MEEHALLAAYRSPIHGTGVTAKAAIAKGAEVVEYTGTLRSHEEVDEEYGGKDTGHTFLFILNDRYVIDGNKNGNLARYINHSCSPNCEAFVVEAESGDPTADRVVIEALRDIEPGEELTYDYGIEVEGRLTKAERVLWACRCGAQNCTGLMLRTKTNARKVDTLA
jgi:uncharacterized protein